MSQYSSYSFAFNSLWMIEINETSAFLLLSFGVVQTWERPAYIHVAREYRVY